MCVGLVLEPLRLLCDAWPREGNERSYEYELPHEDLLTLDEVRLCVQGLLELPPLVGRFQEVAI